VQRRRIGMAARSLMPDAPGATPRRGVYFHNGRFHTLKEALRFYVQRDTDPGKWYPTDRQGKIDKFDDLPPAWRVNVDTIDEPLTRKAGGRPAWNRQDIDDVAAFLETLDDGYTPARSASQRRP
jgi:cytochrome c peroxidase